MLYGWLEVGLSNNNLFSNVNNDDIILRTITSSNKIIFGNTNGLNVIAGMYLYGNNVGINKIPQTNVSLDVNGLSRLKSVQIGLSNLATELVLNGNLILKDISKNYSNISECTLINSNETLYLNYNNTEKLRLTSNNGIYLNDNVYVSNDIYSTGFQITSDIRFKNNIKITDSNSDLNIIKNINIYDYDINNHRTKGYLAQEIEKYFKNCIKEKQAYLKINLAGNFEDDITIRLNNKLYLDELVINDEIIIKDDSGNEEYNVIKNILNNNKIILQNKSSLLHKKNICIYSKFINDMRTLDINQLLALNTSVIKQLIDKIERLENFIYENK